MPLGQSPRCDVQAGKRDRQRGWIARVFVQATSTAGTWEGFVKELQERIAQTIDLPPGVTLKWSGQ